MVILVEKIRFLRLPYLYHVRTMKILLGCSRIKQEMTSYKLQVTACFLYTCLCYCLAFVHKVCIKIVGTIACSDLTYKSQLSLICFKAVGNKDRQVNDSTRCQQLFVL